jgi:hypothetical protein
MLVINMHLVLSSSPRSPVSMLSPLCALSHTRRRTHALKRTDADLQVFRSFTGVQWGVPLFHALPLATGEAEEFDKPTTIIIYAAHVLADAA